MIHGKRRFGLMGTWPSSTTASTKSARVASFCPTAVGTSKAKDDEVELSAIIEVLNERFGTEVNTADQVLFDQFVEAAELDDEVVQRAKANPFDNFALAMKGKVEGQMIDRMDQNQEIVTRYLNDPDFQSLAFRLLVRRIYDEIREENEAVG